MKHETLPASLHAEELNRKISFSDSPFYVVRNNRPWLTEGDKPRIAAISSFGAGGSNAHLIVGAYQPKRQADGNTEQQPHAVVLSAHSEQQLKEYAGKLSSFLARLENSPSAKRIQPGKYRCHPIVRQRAFLLLTCGNRIIPF